MQQLGLHMIENNYWFSIKPVICDRAYGLNVNCMMN